MGKPARPDLDRPGDPRHRPEHLYAQGREGRRRAVQRRVRDVREREGPGQGKEVGALWRGGLSAFYLSPPAGRGRRAKRGGGGGPSPSLNLLIGPPPPPGP